MEFIECNSIMLDERSYMIKAIVAQNRLSYFVAATECSGREKSTHILQQDFRSTINLTLLMIMSTFRNIKSIPFGLYVSRICGIRNYISPQNSSARAA